MHTISSDNLWRLLGTLPQELYDEIYKLTFTADPGVCVVTDDWRPPHLHHIDSHSRKQYAKSYFGGTSTFLIHFPDPRPDIDKDVARWLNGLSHDHVALIQRIKVMTSLPAYAYTDAMRECVAYFMKHEHSCRKGEPAFEAAERIELATEVEAERLVDGVLEE